jgi:hypothetical protein
LPLIALRGFAARRICEAFFFFLAFSLLAGSATAYSRIDSQPAQATGASSTNKAAADKTAADKAAADKAAADKAAADKAAADKAAADKAAADKTATSPKITSAVLFPEAASQASSSSTQDFILEISGNNLDKISDINKAYIGVLPPTGVDPAQIPVFYSQDKSRLLAQFAAPTNYSLQGVTLWTGSALQMLSTGALSCDFKSKVTLTPQIVPKDQAGNKYGNGVAKNFFAIQISIVNECPVAIIVQLAGIRVIVNTALTTPSPLPSAVVGAPYLGTLGAFGGNPPYTWTSSPLPDGLVLSSSGTISGIPASTVRAGMFLFNVQVSDSSTPPISATGIMTLPVVMAQTEPGVSQGAQTTGANDDVCIEKGDLVAFSLDHVTSIFSTDRKLTGRRAIYFNSLQALATIGSAVEPFLAKSFTQGVAILGGGFTTASKEVLVDMSAEQLQNLTSQSFGATEQVASHGSLQKFIFVRRNTHRKCQSTLTERELRQGDFAVLWEVSPASAASPTTQTAPAQAAQKSTAPASTTGGAPTTLPAPQTKPK